MRSVTIYKEINGRVEKINVSETPRDARTEGVNFHQQTLNTYYELECQGKLGDMSPRAKQYVRDVHQIAQTPAYWGEKNTLGYTDER